MRFEDKLDFITSSSNVNKPYTIIFILKMADSASSATNRDVKNILKTRFEIEDQCYIICTLITQLYTMDKTNRNFDRLILNSKTKLISLDQEHEILKQIQERYYSNLQILLESYTYSILKLMKLKLYNHDYMDQCMDFVKKELHRLAMMEKDAKGHEEFTQNVPWWITGAIDAFNDSKHPEIKLNEAFPAELFK